MTHEDHLREVVLATKRSRAFAQALAFSTAANHALLPKDRVNHRLCQIAAVLTAGTQDCDDEALQNLYHHIYRFAGYDYMVDRFSATTYSTTAEVVEYIHGLIDHDPFYSEDDKRTWSPEQIAENPQEQAE